MRSFDGASRLTHSASPLRALGDAASLLPAPKLMPTQLNTAALLLRAGAVCAGMVVALVAGGAAYIRLQRRVCRRLLPLPNRSPRDPSLPLSRVELHADDHHHHPMARLAPVERQVIAHFLDVSSLLHLVRCDRSLRADLFDQEFAWRHVPPIHVRAEAHRDIATQLVEAMPPHARLYFHWTPPQLSDPDAPPSAEELSALRALSLASNSLVGLDATRVRSVRNGSALLDAWPALQQAGPGLPQRLQSLHIRNTEDDDHQRRLREEYPTILAQMPLLHTLVLESDYTSMGGGYGRVLAQHLYLLPSLTKLQVCDLGSSSMLPYLVLGPGPGGCPRRLKRLHLQSMYTDSDTFVRCFTHRHMREGLEHLTLDAALFTEPYSLPPRSFPPEKIRAVFSSSLHALHTLHLRRCGHLLLLLREVRHCRALRYLLLEVSGADRRDDLLLGRNEAAFRVVIEELLTEKQELRIWLFFEEQTPTRPPAAVSFTDKLRSFLIGGHNRNMPTSAGAHVHDDDAGRRLELQWHARLGVGLKERVKFVDALPERFVF
jgi:hypothetical protein